MSPRLGNTGEFIIRQVAKGQNVVSNTHCFALHGCDLEREESGQWLQRSQSSVEHKGTFVCLSVRLAIRLFVPNPLRPEICSTKPEIYPLKPGI